MLKIFSFATGIDGISDVPSLGQKRLTGCWILRPAHSNGALETVRKIFWCKIITHLLTDSCATINTDDSQIKRLAKLLTFAVDLKSKFSCWCHYNACKFNEQAVKVKGAKLRYFRKFRLALIVKSSKFQIYKVQWQSLMGKIWAKKQRTSMIPEHDKCMFIHTSTINWKRCQPKVFQVCPNAIGFWLLIFPNFVHSLPPLASLVFCWYFVQF